MNWFRSHKHLLIILVVTFMLYYPALGNDYFMDDFVYFSNNTFTDLSSILARAFTSPRVVVQFTYYLNHAFFGYTPGTLRMVNVFIHLINVGIVYALANLLFSNTSFKTKLTSPKLWVLTVTGIFALHPIQAAAVDYDIQRYVLLAFLFYFLCVYLYARSVAFPSEKKRNYILLAFCALFSTGTKELVLTLPATILLLELVLVQRESFKEIKGRWVLLLLSVIPFAVTVYRRVAFYFEKAPTNDIANAFGDATTQLTPGWEVSRYEYILSQFKAIVHYIELLLFPIRQRFYYFTEPTHHIDLSVVFAVSILVAIAVLGVYLWKRLPGASFGILFFFVSLAVTSSIFPMSNVVFDYRVYFGTFGYALTITLGVYALAKLLEDRGKLFIQRKHLMMLFVAMYSGFLLYQNFLFGNQLLLLEKEYNNDPTNLRVISHYWRELSEAGENETMLAVSKQGYKIRPDCYSTLMVGISYFSGTNFPKAVEVFNEAIQKGEQIEGKEDCVAAAKNNIADIQSIRDEVYIKIDDLTAQIESSPDNLQLYLDRAELYQSIGEYSLVLSDLETIYVSNPTDELQKLIQDTNKRINDPAE